MNSVALLLLNFEEVRRRNLLLWTSISAEQLTWRPDPEAFTCAEMIRHVLEGEYLYHLLVQHRGRLPEAPSPFQQRAWTSLADELAFAAPYRREFLRMVSEFSEQQLETITIERPERNQRRKLGDYLLRIAYHEAVHTGQLLGYLRQMDASRPAIWD
ncbi:DinB family protein [Hymenobacter terrenus]|uniref:DinB family protein n=1 Tax=Hymenobacter terrenus TaxID=1629124 RepID=UPI0006197A95|nr:DinB family protein [Hymenobacter terrenus]